MDYSNIIPHKPLSAIAKSIEEIRYVPSKVVNERLDQLIKVVIKNNENQTGMAAEIKTSSDDAGKIGKSSLNWAKFVAVLTVVSIIIAIIIAAANWWSSDGTARSINNGFSDLKNAVVNAGKASSRENTGILSELQVGRIKYGKNLDALLDNLASQRAVEQTIIEMMNKRISLLEDEIRKLQQAQSSSKSMPTTPSNVGK